MLASHYTGRFAPSPTGPLHLGSLYTALASFLQARSAQGRWLLRIDDLDTPRNQIGATETILKTLDACGLHWDGNVVYQSGQITLYEEYLHELESKQQLYRCSCSRKILTDIYAGTCRNQTIPADIPHALRIKTDNRTISFNDELQGLITHNLALQHGDFILKRKDNIIAYQFAVVIDDNHQVINHIVRGVDLIDSTPKQIYLQQLLGFNTPSYAHVPVLIDINGQKLSKQTLACPVDISKPSLLLVQLLQLLKQQPPFELQHESVDTILDWAIKHWRLDLLKNIQTVLP